MYKRSYSKPLPLLFEAQPESIRYGMVVLAVYMAISFLYRNLTAALWGHRQDLHYVHTVAKIGNWRLEIPTGKLRCCEETYCILCLPERIPITYETFFAIAHPDDREYVERTLHASLHGEPYDIEYRLLQVSVRDSGGGLNVYFTLPLAL